jgi:ABC-type glycerol-3-phosphate transport system permease component
MAGVLISTIPVLLLLQRFFVAGLAAGAVKG